TEPSEREVVMSPRMQRLLERLKRRAENPDRETDFSEKIFPPASARAVAAAEKQLRFRLPELLKAIYTQIGNGGFGPSYGFLGVQGGATDEEGYTLVPMYRAMRQSAKENRPRHWPEQLLPACRLGCGMWSCLDCARPRVPVLIFEPNNLEEGETDQEEAVLNWTSAFFHEANSFASWLEAWLNGAYPKQPVWPSASWLRQRLWPRKPANVRLFMER